MPRKKRKGRGDRPFFFSQTILPITDTRSLGNARRIHLSQSSSIARSPLPRGDRTRPACVRRESRVHLCTWRWLRPDCCLQQTRRERRQNSCSHALSLWRKLSGSERTREERPQWQERESEHRWLSMSLRRPWLLRARSRCRGLWSWKSSHPRRSSSPALPQSGLLHSSLLSSRLLQSSSDGRRLSCLRRRVRNKHRAPRTLTSFHPCRSSPQPGR